MIRYKRRELGTSESSMGSSASQSFFTSDHPPIHLSSYVSSHPTWLAHLDTLQAPTPPTQYEKGECRFTQRPRLNICLKRHFAASRQSNSIQKKIGSTVSSFRQLLIHLIRSLSRYVDTTLKGERLSSYLFQCILTSVFLLKHQSVHLRDIWAWWLETSPFLNQDRRILIT